MLRIPGLPASLHYGNLVNRACPLNRGVVSWWLALPQGGKGNTLFDIASHNHGTLTNGPTWGGALGRPGGFGALIYDGTDDYLLTTLGVASLGGSVSVAMWFYPATSLTAYQALWDCTTGGSAGRQLSLFLGGTASQLYVCVGGDSPGFISLSESNVLNVWQHIAMTWNGSTVTIYRNGRSVGSAARTATLSDVAMRFADNPSGGGAAFNGLMDDIRMWRTALSPADVAAIYGDSLLAYPQTLNRVRPYSVLNTAGGAATVYSQYWWNTAYDYSGLGM